jgi:hypothetical protein
LWGHLAALTKVLVNIPLLTNNESSHLDEWQREKAQKFSSICRPEATTFGCLLPTTQRQLATHPEFNCPERTCRSDSVRHDSEYEDQKVTPTLDRNDVVCRLDDICAAKYQ